MLCFAAQRGCASKKSQLPTVVNNNISNPRFAPKMSSSRADEAIAHPQARRGPFISVPLPPRPQPDDVLKRLMQQSSTAGTGLIITPAQESRARRTIAAEPAGSTSSSQPRDSPDAATAAAAAAAAAPATNPSAQLFRLITAEQQVGAGGGHQILGSQLLQWRRRRAPSRLLGSLLTALRGPSHWLAAATCRPCWWRRCPVASSGAGHRHRR